MSVDYEIHVYYTGTQETLPARVIVKHENWTVLSKTLSALGVSYYVDGLLAAWDASGDSTKRINHQVKDLSEILGDI